jgi:hypothetical protein
MAFDPVKLGDQMIVAGEKQKSAGTMLKQAAVDLRGFGNLLVPNGQIETSMLSVRDGVKSIRDLLNPVVTALQYTVNAFNGFTIPTINPQATTIDFPVVGRVRFITGINLGSTHPLTGLATRVDTIRTNIANIRDALTTMATDIKDLRDELPTIKASLLNAADGMETGATGLFDSGKVLQAAGKQLGGT